MFQEDLSQARDRYREQLQQSVQTIVEKLRALATVHRISLFGSYARGSADLFTDLDVLVIMQSDVSFIERQQQLYQLLGVPVDMDLLCYTPEEFQKIRDGAFFRHALQDEIVLYEKNAA